MTYTPPFRQKLVVSAVLLVAFLVTLPVGVGDAVGIDEATTTDPMASLSVNASSSTVEGTSDTNITLSLTLENTGDEDGNATAIAITDFPEGWNVTSDSSDWQANQNTWLSLDIVPAGGQYQVQGTVTIPGDAGAGEYTISARGNVAPEIEDTASVTVTVEKPSSDTPTATPTDTPEGGSGTSTISLNDTSTPTDGSTASENTAGPTTTVADAPSTPVPVQTPTDAPTPTPTPSEDDNGPGLLLLLGGGGVVAIVLIGTVLYARGSTGSQDKLQWDGVY